MNWERRETPPLVPTRCGLQFITAPFKNTPAGQPTNTTGRHPRRKLGGTESNRPLPPSERATAEQQRPTSDASRKRSETRDRHPATGHRQPPRQAPNHPPLQKARIQNTPRNARSEAHRDPVTQTPTRPRTAASGAHGGNQAGAGVLPNRRPRRTGGARPAPFDHTLGDSRGYLLIWDIRPISAAPSDWGTQACV